MKQNKVQLFLHFENKVDSLNPQTKGRKVTTSCQNGGDFSDQSLFSKCKTFAETL